MPADGGEARRLTYMPEDDLVVGWTPDGKSVLFNSHRDEEGVVRLWKMALDGVTAEALPLPQGYTGSYSPDGARIAYQPMGFAGEYRFYRGGMLSPVWIANLSTGALEKLPHGNYNNRQPMWAGDRIYFVSDRTGIFNLYSYDLAGRQTRQLTNFERFGIRWAGAGGDAVAFVQEGRLHLHDMRTGQTRPLEVRVSPDTSEWKERKVNAARTIESATLSHDGRQVVFGARGEALTLDAGGGATRNLTETSGVAERYPTLSPDGRSVAYLSDESGEYQLHVRPAAGGEARKINVEAKPSFYRELNWSPDSKRVAFIDRRLGLWVADVERGTAARADVSRYTWQEEYFPSWSPDGRWLVYSKYVMPNRERAVFVYDTREGRARQITDGRTHAESPVFDANGKYIYFFSSPNAGTSEYGWGVLSGMFARPLVTRRLHAFVLRADAPAPLFPNAQPNPEAKLSEPASEVRIDFEELGERVVDLPQPPRDYERIVSGKPGVLHVLVSEWPKSPAFTNPSSTLYRYDLSKPNAFEKLVEEVNGFELSGDGERLLYAKGRGDWFLVSADSAPKPDEGKLD
ncbi:MAG TPA: hypothetical protein VGV38_16335, partial [Pyrinomonadaceae bacterium]|nr:hypothetical protein [Pyrinomonadaceae bacterium]